MKSKLTAATILAVLAVSCGDDRSAPSPGDVDAGVEDTGGDVTEDQSAVDLSPDSLDEDIAPLDLPVEVSDPEDATEDTFADPWDLSDTSPDAFDAGQDPLPPYPEPSVMGWVYAVDDSFWQNMDDFLLDVLQQGDVSLYLTVFSANFFHKQDYRALGAEIVRHPQSFFANAVIPLLERYGDSGAIWAIDCMNEPEAMVADPAGNRTEWGVTWEEMRAYLSYCADIVHLYSPLPASAGSGWHDWKNVEAGYFSGLGLDFLDFHIYADAPDIPSVEELGVDSPVIIGECGQSTDAWSDDLQLAAVAQCFGQAETGGYAAALSWYYDYAGSLNRHAHLESDGSWRPVEQVFEDYADSELWIGTNLAWFSGAYDHDMAVNPRHPSWTVAYDHDYAAAVVADLDAHAVELLRFWVFEGQEALYVHQLFEDFEDGLSRWSTFGDGVSIRQSAQHASDGESSLAIHLSAQSTGWYGVSAQWLAEMPLNLTSAFEWSYTVHSALDRAVGVNLAFVVDTDGGAVTYQTRSGADGGQVWLQPGESAEVSVSLAPSDFSLQWALDAEPNVGAERPSDADLPHVRELRLRVYVSQSQVGLTGDLFVDAMRVR